MEEAAGSTGRRAAVREVVEEAAVRESAVVGAAARDVVEEAAVRERSVVGAAARDVVEEAAVREVVISAVSKCMTPDRLGGTLHWESVLVDGLRGTG